jgi:hypothetical protein
MLVRKIEHLRLCATPGVRERRRQLVAGAHESAGGYRRKASKKYGNCFQMRLHRRTRVSKARTR